eukprot:INCI16674.1.p2 GENE.INCI16674.1~~INCI16674.1.p2  ORF type:complete len:443 (-),score=88.03 INCI16674.1:295-1590(-)
MAEAAPAVAAAAAATEIPENENVDLLLEKHRETLSAVRASFPKLKEQDTWPFYDDIFFLRFVLSFKTVPKSIDAVNKCLEWRSEHAELLAAVPEDVWSMQAIDGPMGHIFKEMVKYQVASVWPHEALTDNGFLVLIRGAMGQPKLLHTHLTRQDNIDMNFSFRETAYRYCDSVTRRTRRLAKQTLVFDTQGMRFSDMVDPNQQKVMGVVSKVSSFAYPQLMRKMCIVNAPKWMSVVVKLARAFLPKSTMDKIDVFSSTEKLYRSEFGAAILRTEHLPEFLGGDVKELPPQLTGELIAEDLDHSGGYEQLNVTARSFIDAKVSIPMAHSKVEIKAFVEHFGINFEVALEHGELNEQEAGAAAAAADETAGDDGEAVSPYLQDPSPMYNLDGRRTVLKESDKLKHEDGPSRLFFRRPRPRCSHHQMGQHALVF